MGLFSKMNPNGAADDLRRAHEATQQRARNRDDRRFATWFFQVCEQVDYDLKQLARGKCMIKRFLYGPADEQTLVVPKPQDTNCRSVIVRSPSEKLTRALEQRYRPDFIVETTLKEELNRQLGEVEAWYTTTISF